MQGTSADLVLLIIMIIILLVILLMIMMMILLMIMMIYIHIEGLCLPVRKDLNMKKQPGTKNTRQGTKHT